MTKYYLIMKDESGCEWCADDFYTVADAMDEAKAKAEADNWTFVKIAPYEEANR